METEQPLRKEPRSGPNSLEVSWPKAIASGWLYPPSISPVAIKCVAQGQDLSALKT